MRITSHIEADEIPLEALRELLEAREAAVAADAAPVEITANKTLTDLRNVIAHLEREYILELRRLGEPWHELGSAFEVTGNAVRYRAVVAPVRYGTPEVPFDLLQKVHGLVTERARKLRTRDRNGDVIGTRLALEEYKAAVAALHREELHALREEGKSWSEIGKMFGVSAGAAFYRSLPPQTIRARSEGAKRRSDLPPPPGRSIQEVAEALGRSYTWVQQRLNRPGIETISYQHGERQLTRILSPIEAFRGLR
jgi:hypothetical protein